tara:strand:+ start:698 stop:1081 length:384 start_codon:yes stop_codon:yes gene_type:complete
MNMNLIQEIPSENLGDFKQKVKQWIELDSQIEALNKKCRELKKIRDKQLEPEITTFMVQYNISDLNTENGKLKCNTRNTKKPLNRVNIRDNLSKVVEDINKLDEAMDLIMNNREIVTKYKLLKPKVK